MGLLLFALLLYGIWFRPQVRKIQDLKRDLRTLEIQRKDVEALGDISQLKQSAVNLEEKVKQKRFRRNEIPRILEILKEHLSKHRLETISLNPELKETLSTFVLAPGVTYETLPLRLHLKGDYAAVGECLGSLSGLPFLSTIEFLQLESPDATHPRVEAQFTLLVYLEEEKETGGKED